VNQSGGKRAPQPRPEDLEVAQHAGGSACTLETLFAQQLPVMGKRLLARDVVCEKRRTAGSKFQWNVRRRQKRHQRYDRVTVQLANALQLSDVRYAGACDSSSFVVALTSEPKFRIQNYRIPFRIAIRFLRPN
jgi:hypothetical protein